LIFLIIAQLAPHRTGKPGALLFPFSLLILHLFFPSFGCASRDGGGFRISLFSIVFVIISPLVFKARLCFSLTLLPFLASKFRCGRSLLFLRFLLSSQLWDDPQQPIYLLFFHCRPLTYHVPFLLIVSHQFPFSFYSFPLFTPTFWYNTYVEQRGFPEAFFFVGTWVQFGFF